MSDCWVYTPASIHLSDHKNTYASSGVYLFNSLTNDYLILSISSLPNIELCKFHLTSNELINDTIGWLPLELDKSRNFKQDDIPGSFYNFVEGLSVSDGFELKPNGCENLSLLSFKLSLGNPNSPLFGPDSLFPLNPIVGPKSVEIPSRITIDCCPFSLTNVAVFINYKHHGTLNYKIHDGTGYLSDCRYFDDIVGGLVKLDNVNSESIGLVAGSLNKRNGDGSLLSIVSWSTITSLLQIPSFSFKYSALPVKFPQNKVEIPIINSVVRISTQTTSGDQFWGSAVVLSNEYIVTNNHVIKFDELRSLQIHSPNGVELSLVDVDIVRSPIIGYDLCFLKLKKSNYNLIPANICKTYRSQIKSLKIGAPVTSIGYGLFFSRNVNELIPLHSVGIINTLTPIEIEPNHQELAMIIASAGCWNGSSGGGVFNKKDELIGIMTSNGKLTGGEIIPNFTFIIPITIIEKCLFMIKNNLKPVDINQKIENLWLLKNNSPHIEFKKLPSPVVDTTRQIPKLHKL